MPNKYQITLIDSANKEISLSPLAELSFEKKGLARVWTIKLPEVKNSSGEILLREFTSFPYGPGGSFASINDVLDDIENNLIIDRYISIVNNNRGNIKITLVEGDINRENSQSSTPPPLSPTPKPTQEEVKIERQQERDKADQNKLESKLTTTNSSIINSSIPNSLKPKGIQKLPQIIFNQIKKIKILIIPTLINIITQKLGIRPIIIDFVLKKDFSKPSVIKLSKNLGSNISPLNPDVIESVFTGKINLNSLSKEEKKKILLSLYPLLPQICPSQPVLKNIINIRNNLLGSLEKIAQILQTITIALTIASIGLRISKSILKILRGIKLSILIVGKSLSLFVPPLRLPASLQSALSEIDVVAEQQKYTLTGTPKIDKIESAINSIAPPIAVISATINTAILLLRILDIFLLKCLIENDIKDELTPISEDLQNINNRQEIAEETLNQTSYQGFIIEIEEVPFNPTVTRRKAVGINQSGIKLIETPLSFTTNPQTLIDELKFIIDRDDLKAY
jgi:hypothetical protein